MSMPSNSRSSLASQAHSRHFVSQFSSLITSAQDKMGQHFPFSELQFGSTKLRHSFAALVSPRICKYPSPTCRSLEKCWGSPPPERRLGESNTVSPVFFSNRDYVSPQSKLIRRNSGTRSRSSRVAVVCDRPVLCGHVSLYSKTELNISAYTASFLVLAWQNRAIDSESYILWPS